MIGVRPYDYRRKMECVFKGRRYTVRDNGAVFRHAKDGQKPRDADEYWTFGRPNPKTGYMELASVRVHRIVATAFHGEAPTPEHVVDHIDTNRRNNRPENLRWMTKMENLLNNPISVAKIRARYGSVEHFLELSPKERNAVWQPNFSWMRPVNPREAQLSLQRLSESAKENRPLEGGVLGPWIHQPLTNEASVEEGSEDTPAITLNAVQRKWRTPCEFPCCPETVSDAPIACYAKNLAPEKVFCQNEFKKSIVDEFVLSPDEQTLWILCHFDDSSVKPWSLAEVTFEEGTFVHKNRGSYFVLEGAQKALCLAQGKVWEGEPTIDDFC